MSGKIKVARKHGAYWHKRKSVPKVAILARALDEDETVSKIFDEVKSEYPAGFGAVRDTGLALFWPVSWTAAYDPAFLPPAIEIPFKGPS
jgi:hypothetical protein